MRYYIDSEHRAYLQSFRGLVCPEFIADGGLVVQIPVKNSEVSQQQLRAEILKLSQEQGNEYLRELVERKDIDWQQIVLTQKDWDYKQQGLTPAGAAILAIAITIATSGAGSAISGSVSGSLTNTLGASTANAVGAMSSAAFTSLVSQAGIALVNNQGDIKKTLKQLGQKDSIKQLATSVVTAGLLNKIGGTQWASKFSGTDLDDRVIKAMIDSTARAVVETGINGGSLSENLERALKAGLLNAVHGELAENIKVLEESHYLLHKLAHAAAGCAVGAVQKQCEAGAIGAAVGEVVANAMPPKNGVFYSDKEKETIKYAGQLVAGVVSAYAGHDAQSAMNFAQTAIENNGVRDWLASKTSSLLSSASTQGKQLINQWEVLMRKGDIKGLQRLKTQIDDYLNSQYQKRQLSEIEMHAFGALAGITEAAFPTHVLDFAGGLGKGIDKGTDAAKALMSAKEYAKNNFRYVFTSRNANTPILPNTPYHPSVVEARKLTAQQKEDWIISLPTKILQQPIKMPDGRVVKIDVDLEPTIRRILDNKPNSTLQDGKPYLNNTTPLLPKNISYTEWVVPTVAVNGRGTQRIVVGSDGSMWYTPNHFGYIRPDMSKPISPSNKPIGNTWRRIK